MSSYDGAKAALAGRDERLRVAAASLFSGFVAATVAAPADLLKTRSAKRGDSPSNFMFEKMPFHSVTAYFEVNCSDFLPPKKPTIPEREKTVAKSTKEVAHEK